MSLPQEPLVIRRTRFSRVMRYSCLHSHSHSLHHSLTRRLRRLQDAPLPNPTTWLDCHGFGGVLEPRYIVGAESLDQ